MENAQFVFFKIQKEIHYYLGQLSERYLKEMKNIKFALSIYETKTKFTHQQIS